MRVNSVFVWKGQKIDTKLPVQITSVTPITSKEMEFSAKRWKSNGLRTTKGNSIGSGTFKCEAFHIVLGQPEMEPPEDLFISLKFFLIVGRILGVLPFSGVFGQSYKQLHFYAKSPAAIFSFVVLAILTLNLFLGAANMIHKPKRNALEIATSAASTIQFLWAWLIYFNFLVRGKKFLGMFSNWDKTTVYYGGPDRHLKRDVIGITIILLISAILENAILHLEYITALDFISGTRFSNETIGRNFLETYYRRSHEHWSRMIGFHEVVPFVAFIQHKWMLYGCNYIDIMIAVFSRAIYFKFKMLHELTYEHLAKPLRKGYNLPKSNISGIHAWVQLAYDHKKLCDLLQEIDNFFSPLIFGSYAVNIFYICIQLLEGLKVDMSAKSLVHSVYAPWSFLHIIMRIYIIYICAARINTYAHRIRNVLQECPIDQYNAEVARLDKKVTTGSDIGLTGLGCFVVTKPFILKIISVVFTFEIVLLQGAPNSGC